MHSRPAMADRSPRGTDSQGLLLGDIAVGTLVGSYHLRRRLPGHGAGHLFEAVHVVLPRRAAVAVLPAVDDLTRDLVHHGLRVACLVDALDHPGIPRVYECGMLEGRRPWIATELVEGKSLGAMLDARTLTMLEVASILRDAAAILAHAHARGLVHRDVNPTTLLLPSPPRAFPLAITDWNGARALDAHRPLPRLPSETTAAYVAPEQRDGELLDGRADVYSLGILARRMIERTEGVATPPVLTALVRRMTARSPAGRPTALEVRDHAAWLAAEIERESPVPEPVPHERTVPAPPFTRPITSEVAPNISGEIIASATRARRDADR